MGWKCLPPFHWLLFQWIRQGIERITNLREPAARNQRATGFSLPCVCVCTGAHLGTIPGVTERAARGLGKQVRAMQLSNREAASAGKPKQTLNSGNSQSISPLRSPLFPVSLLWLDMSLLSISPTYSGLQVAVSILLGHKLFNAMCLLSICAFHCVAILSTLLKEGLVL